MMSSLHTQNSECTAMLIVLSVIFQSLEHHKLNSISNSSGSYTATAGMPEIVQRVSEFITRRDGGAPSYPENIYISPGSQWALTVTITITDLQ